MVGIHFGRNQLGLLVIGEAMPAVLSVPVLADHGAIVESDFDLTGKNEVAFAMYGDFAVIGRVLLIAFGFVPVAWPIRRVGNFVVEDRGPGDRLIEVPAQVLARNLFDSLEEISSGGMRELIALKPGAHRALHGVFADDALQRQQHAGGLAVSDATIGSVAGKLPRFARHGIESCSLRVAKALFFAVAEGDVLAIHHATIFAIERLQHLDFGIAVDAFVEP